MTLMDDASVESPECTPRFGCAVRMGAEVETVDKCLFILDKSCSAASALRLHPAEQQIKIL